MSEDLKAEYHKLFEKYEELNDRYHNLKDEHEKLKKEYSENMIIESMNDMKIKYEELMNTTIPIYRYEFLEKKYADLKKRGAAVAVLLDYTAIYINKIHVNYGEIDYEKLDYKLDIMKEMLEECTK